MSDTCPRCLRREVLPIRDMEGYDGRLHASYRCDNCGHTWVTRRAAEPEGDRYATYDDPDTWEAEDDFRDYDRERGWL